MPDQHQHPDVRRYDAAVAEHEAREFAESIGYSFGVLTDGTIVLEPPADPTCCTLCASKAGAEHDGDKCADCGAPLDALNRHQVIVAGDGSTRFGLRFVCRDDYVRRLHLAL
ncbi:hypothetical protein PBI_LEMURIA_49 [Mycobacterium phage Lemuria]|uniref:Uncharacterized protein n=1 Tax=Mycobacterium phage Lemuria TaxID=2599868 RepID=A0A5J6TK57_9CAUD|nr:hypothetical protein KDW76_gp49 [Mycobacterium phage Lemuria]QFG10129.1 hypothetical protein PBI_LEMURIA_49 [Mycobacterium phage Lemuria]